MQYARDPRGKMVRGEDIHMEGVIHKSYTCTHCREPVSIVRCVKKLSHFRHRKGGSCVSKADADEKEKMVREQYQNIRSLFHSHWTNLFPSECVEVPVGKTCRSDCIPNRLDGVKHCIEFQHSAISQSEVDRRNTVYSSAGYELTWIIDVSNHNIKAENITYDLEKGVETRRLRFLKVTEDDVVSNALCNVCGADTSKDVVILLDPGFDTGLPLLKVQSSDSMDDGNLMYYTEIDRQEFLTSMGCADTENHPTEILSGVRDLNYGHHLSGMVNKQSRSQVADMIRVIEKQPLSFWKVDTYIYRMTDSGLSINYSCDGPYTGKWRFTDMMSSIAKISRRSRHAYTALKMFLNNLQVIAFNQTVTFEQHEDSKMSTLTTNDLDGVLNYMTFDHKTVHLLELRALFALRELCRCTNFDKSLVSNAKINNVMDFEILIDSWKAIDCAKGEHIGEANINVWDDVRLMGVPYHQYKEDAREAKERIQHERFIKEEEERRAAEVIRREEAIRRKKKEQDLLDTKRAQEAHAAQCKLRALEDKAKVQEAHAAQCRLRALDRDRVYKAERERLDIINAGKPSSFVSDMIAHGLREERLRASTKKSKPTINNYPYGPFRRI